MVCRRFAELSWPSFDPDAPLPESTAAMPQECGPDQVLRALAAGLVPPGGLDLFGVGRRAELRLARPIQRAS